MVMEVEGKRYNMESENIEESNSTGTSIVIRKFTAKLIGLEDSHYFCYKHR